MFSRIRTEYGEIRSISPYLVRMLQNTYQNNSKYGHFLRSAIYGENLIIDFISFSLRDKKITVFKDKLKAFDDFKNKENMLFLKMTNLKPLSL